MKKLKIRAERLSIVRLSILLVLLLGICSDSSSIELARADKTILVSEDERSIDDWLVRLRQKIEGRKWEDIEAIVRSRTDYTEKAAVFSIVISELMKIENDREAKDLFDRAFKFKEQEFSYESGLVDPILSNAYKTRFDREEREIQQILQLIEKNIAVLDRQNAANELRKVLDRITYPLEVSPIQLDCSTECVLFSYPTYNKFHYELKALDGERRFYDPKSEFARYSEKIDREKYLQNKVTTIERIIEIAIQLNAPDLADTAFDRLLKSSLKINRSTQADIVEQINTALNKISKKFPRSPTPKKLRDRLQNSGLEFSSTEQQSIGDREMELERAISLAENTWAFDDSKVVASKLRNIISQSIDVLEFKNIEIPTGIGQGETADSYSNREEEIEKKSILFKRIVILAIRLNAPDIAESALNTISPDNVDFGYLKVALSEVTALFPNSPIPKKLQARLKK
jgi:hypothetical protein